MSASSRAPARGGCCRRRLSGKLAGAPFTALVELDLRGESPDREARPVHRRHRHRRAAARAGRGRGHRRARGPSAARAARARQLPARAGRGHGARGEAGSAAASRVLGAAQRPVTEIRVREAVIDAAAGQPVRMRLDGTLDQTAVRIQLSTGSLADFAGDATRVPFAMTAQAAGTRLSLDGEVTLPLGSAAQLTLRDERRAARQLERAGAGGTARVGPLVAARPDPHELHRLRSAGADGGRRAAAGSSGSGTLDLSGPRPRLQMQVAAPTLQLDDFPMPQRLTDPPESPVPGRRSARRDHSAGRPGRPAVERALPAALRCDRRRASRRGAVRCRPAGRWRLAPEAAGRAPGPGPCGAEPSGRRHAAVDGLRPEGIRSRLPGGGLCRALRLRHHRAPPEPGGRPARPVQPEPGARGPRAVAGLDHAQCQRQAGLRRLADRAAQRHVQPVVGEPGADAAAADRPGAEVPGELHRRPLRPEGRRSERRQDPDRHQHGAHSRYGPCQPEDRRTRLRLPAARQGPGPVSPADAACASAAR